MSAYKIRKALKVSTFFMVDRILHPHRLLQVIPKKGSVVKSGGAILKKVVSLCYG